MAIIFHESFQNGVGNWVLGQGSQIAAIGGKYSNSPGAYYVNGSSMHNLGLRVHVSYHDIEPVTDFSIGYDVYQFQRDSTTLPDNLAPIINMLNESGVVIAVYIRYIASIGRHVVHVSKSAAYQSSPIAVSSYLPKSFSPYHYNHYDLEMSATQNGFARVFVNGTKVIDIADYDFSFGGKSYANQIKLFPPMYTSGSGNNAAYYDNVYVNDEPVRLGEINIVTVRPSGTTRQDQFVPSVGGEESYTMVNKTAYSASQTDNISSSVSARSLFEYSDVSSLISADAKIHALAINSFNYKKTAGPATLNQVIRIGGETDTYDNIRLYAGQHASRKSTNYYDFTGRDVTREMVDSIIAGVELVNDSDFTIIQKNDGRVLNNANSAVHYGEVAPILEGQSLVFDGSQNVVIDQNLGFNIDGEVSVEVEFNAESSARQQCIFDLRSDMKLVIDNSEIKILIRTTTGIETVDVGELIDGWNNIGLMVYLDSSLVKLNVYHNDSLTNDIIISPIDNSNEKISFGSTIDNSDYFIGKLKNFRMIKRPIWTI